MKLDTPSITDKFPGENDGELAQRLLASLRDIPNRTLPRFLPGGEVEPVSIDDVISALMRLTPFGLKLIEEYRKKGFLFLRPVHEKKESRNLVLNLCHGITSRVWRVMDRFTGVSR